jgi:hypothetical protein
MSWVPLPGRCKKCFSVKEVTLKGNKTLFFLRHVYLFLETESGTLYFDLLWKYSRLPGDEPNPSRAVFRNLLILPHSALFHSCHVVASFTSISASRAFKFRYIGDLFKDACPSDVKSALYLIKHTVWDSGGTAPCFLSVGTRWWWVVRFWPRSL